MPWDGINLANLTPSVLLGITVLLILTGRLVPRSALKDKDQQIELWRKTAELREEARATSDAQTAQLLELAKTTHSIIDAAFGPGRGVLRQSGDTNVVSSPTGK